mmetsp:Transcript_84838/g.226777  ORF Transcript_84838/g.226777 Transcript_84838/m.226777 type:complete len:207 (-) Transcript_84838:296-916(-)
MTLSCSPSSSYVVARSSFLHGSMVSGGSSAVSVGPKVTDRVISPSLGCRVSWWTVSEGRTSSGLSSSRISSWRSDRWECRRRVIRSEVISFRRTRLPVRPRFPKKGMRKACWTCWPSKACPKVLARSKSPEVGMGRRWYCVNMRTMNACALIEACNAKITEHIRKVNVDARQMIYIHTAHCGVPLSSRPSVNIMTVAAANNAFTSK